MTMQVFKNYTIVVVVVMLKTTATKNMYGTTLRGTYPCLLDIKSIYTNPGIICPVVRYAPISAIKPIIANLPLSFSATIFSFSTDFVSFICLVGCLAKTLLNAILKQI